MFILLLGLLHRVAVGNVTDVLEVNSVSFFRVEVSKMSIHVGLYTGFGPADPRRGSVRAPIRANSGS